ncbi:MAG: M24 family metallopeptidase [Candidatus Sericytochromatia bacterium]
MATEVLPDDRALRGGRRERAFAQMEAFGLDVLVLGRQANVRYFTGAPQLWVAGTRPFGPMCTVVRATREIYLNSTWDEGMPDDIPHDHLYGLAWNPMTLISVLQSIDGAAGARRVGTDALSPTFATLLPMAFPNAELVDGEPAMRAARRVKTPEEVTAIRAALRVAEDGVAAGLSDLAPGASEQSLAGAVLQAMAAGGVTTPATQDAAWITSPEHPWRRALGNGQVRAGDLVALKAGVLADGYLGEVGRTYCVGHPERTARSLFGRANNLRDRLFAACRAGAAATDLFAAYEAAGEPLPPMPVAHGLGLGFDPPVVTPRLPATAADERLDPGMVLAVTGYVWEQGVGAVFSRDAVLITSDDPELLTPHSETAAIS